MKNGANSLGLKSFKQNSILKIGIVYPDDLKWAFHGLSIRVLSYLITKQGNSIVDLFFMNINGSENIYRYSLYFKKSPLEFDLLLFTIPDECLYLNILKFLEYNEIPFFSIQRGSNYPIIGCGGSAIINPLPIAPFFDFLVIGEAESVISFIINEVIDNRQSKQKLYERLQNVEGIYVPQIQNSVKRAVEGNISLPFPYINSGIRSIDKILRVEITRGCKWKCRFCQIPNTRKPYREITLETIKDYISFLIKDNSNHFKKCALISFSPLCYSNIKELLEFLHTKNLIPIVHPMRIDRFDDDIISLLNGIIRVGIESSESQRRFLGKSIDDNTIYRNIEKINNNPKIKALFLNFMIGTPRETWKDIEEIVNLCNKIARKCKKIKILRIMISIFMPECFVPFEEETMEDINLIRQKFNYT